MANKEDNYTCTVEQIIYRSFVKYDRLQNIVYETFSNTSIANATELNIFIDLYSIMHAIFSEKNRVIINNYTDITSCVINMCAHYRAFFRRIGVKTKFFLIFSFNICDINRKFVAGYNESFYRKITTVDIFRETAMNNFELLDLLCPYLPDIFFIKSIRNFESAVIIASLIDKLNSPIPNLIISKDIYPMQLCALYPNTSFLRPLKISAGDSSVMVPINEKPNFRNEFWQIIGHFRNYININQLIDISPINLPLFSALTKMPERDINKTICNYQIANKIIKDIVGTENIKVIPKQLYDNQYIVDKLPISKIEALYNAYDIEYMKTYYNIDPESKSIKLINLQDDAAVNHINSKFLANNPIDLSKL